MSDYYEPKVLRGAIRKAERPKLFFKSRFFSNAVTFPTETVSFEFQEAARRLAPYVNPHLGAQAMSRDGYEVRDFRPPLVASMRPITNDTLAQKALGELPYNSGVTPEERAAKIAAQDIIDLQDAILRREEFMCARVKQDGKLIIKGDGVNAVVDYGFSNIKTPDAADRWTSSYDILGYLEALAEELQKNGVNPDMLILGSSAAKALRDNNKFIKLLDNRRVELGEIRPSQLEDGVNYIGRLVTFGAAFDIYSYAEWVPYDTDGGKLKPIIDPETVIMQSSRERNSMLYGAVTLNDEAGEFHTYMEEFVPNTWFTRNPPQKFISLSSRPLPMPHDLKSWVVLKGVVTGGV